MSLEGPWLTLPRGENHPCMGQKRPLEGSFVTLGGPATALGRVEFHPLGVRKPPLEGSSESLRGSSFTLRRHDLPHLGEVIQASATPENAHNMAPATARRVRVVFMVVGSSWKGVLRYLTRTPGRSPETERESR